MAYVFDSEQSKLGILGYFYSDSCKKPNRPWRCGLMARPVSGVEWSGKPNQWTMMCQLCCVG